MNDKQRAEFEKFYEDLDSCQLTADDRLGPLNKRVKGYLFATWQAAIASVVVELPKPSIAVDYGYELNDIQNTLTDAGIRYE